MNLEFQVGRLISDAESEKATRARVHMDFEVRIRSLEKQANRGIGLIIGMQFIFQAIGIGVLKWLLGAPK